MADDKTKTDDKTDGKKKGTKQEKVTFRSTRYPQAVVQVPGRTLRESITFVGGEYTTDDPDEIKVLDDRDYAQRDDK